MSVITRIWSDEFELLYSSETDPRTPEGFMREHAAELGAQRLERNYTIDHDGRRSFATREGGRIIWSDGGCTRTPNAELLKHILTPPNPFAIPRVDDNGWHYLIRYPAGTVVQCAGDWDVAHKHLRQLRQLYDEQHRAQHGRPADSTIVLLGAYPPNAIGGPEGKGGVFSYGYSPNLIGNIDIDPSEWIQA